MTIRPLLAALALCACGLSQAQTSFRPLLGSSLTGGGEKLATVEFTNGMRQDVRSGGLVHLFGGFEVQPGGLPMTFQANIGYHVDNSAAKNGEVRFQRWPVEALLAFHAGPNWRVGGGLRKSNGVKLSSSGATYVGNYELSAKAGLVLQAEHVWDSGLGVLVRVVNEKFRVGRAEVEGRHLGVGMSYRF